MRCIGAFGACYMIAYISLAIDIDTTIHDHTRTNIDGAKYADIEVSVRTFKSGGLRAKFLKPEEVAVGTDGMAYIEFLVPTSNTTRHYSAQAHSGDKRLITVKFAFLYKCQYCGQFCQRLDDSSYCANCIEDLYQR
jgi:hypothetical protein